MNRIKNTLKFVFSLLMYIASMATFLMFALFMLNWGEITINGNDKNTGFFVSVIINAILVLFFTLSHSIMARPKFKEWFKSKFDASTTRAVYLLFSVLTLTLLMLFWKPLSGTIYDFRGTPIGRVLISINLIGWIILVASSFQINHFQFFGLSQTYHKMKNQEFEPTGFKIVMFYRYIRHPIYTGWFLVIWATPFLTFSHIMLAGLLSGYMVLATVYEEKDLTEFFGKDYINYKKQVPYRYIPLII